MLTILLFSACKAPPPAPEGLDDSMRYLYRSFYDTDDVLGAGLTGLMNWFDDEGVELLDARADLENVGAFSLGPLEVSDLALIPFEDPKPAQATGVVSLAEMACRWKRAEGLLVRPDQHVVFDKDWDSYQRTFVTSRAAYEDASADDDFDPIREPLDPAALAEVERTMLVTENVPTTSELGITTTFDLTLHFRHGEFVIQDEPLHAYVILGYLPHPATSDGGGSTIDQNYSIEANIERPGGKTLRVFANWLEFHSSLLDSDSNVASASSVNKSQDSAERLSGLCSGDEDL